MSFAPLARAAEPAVVTIVINIKSKKGRKVRRGLGSGFIIDKQGTILTNNHVVAGGNAIDVEMFNGKVLEGKVVGTDPMTDVGVVKIEPPEGVTPLPLGDSDAISVGDWVFAIGNPLGLSHTVTSGILSARGRTTKDVPLKAIGGGDAYFDFLQTDAAINPGNSGGPLLNLKGEVIGINTAINAQGQGLAFAIPINMVKQMLPSLVKEGRLVRSYLGVGIEDAAVDEKTGTRGAIVFRVYKGTPADKAGLKSGDHVLSVDGITVRDSSQMRWLISIAGVGKKVTLRLIRDGKTFDLPVKLEKLPEKNEPMPDDDDEEEGPFPFPH
ncbi:MAG: trypsin-like peptidase domain-containing protein [Deltaproteobacteria bacterium]|nr:trypsin-like peptidase domain-containing protein [Deltaproteobacteria bacterium]